MSVLMDFRAEHQHFWLRSAAICFHWSHQEIALRLQRAAHISCFHRRIDSSDSTNTIRQKHFWKSVSYICTLTPQSKRRATTEHCAGKL